MHSNDFEAAFDKFLEKEVYDQTEGALFALARAAFQSGWKAAGGEISEPQFAILGQHIIWEKTTEDDLSEQGETLK